MIPCVSFESVRSQVIICWSVELLMLTNGNEKLKDHLQVLSQLLGKEEDLKKFAKKMMPFVQMIKEQYAVKGAAALAVTCDFDQVRT